MTNRVGMLTLTTLCAAALGCKSGGAGGGGAAEEAADGRITLMDPSGDDNGPGTYIYPTKTDYTPGSFDMRKLEIIPKGDVVEFHLTVNRRIDDPWDSKAWNGNGFSLQMAFVHIDTDHAPGSGEVVGLPGTNVRFDEKEAWDKVVILSPQGTARLNTEVQSKAAYVAQRVVIPKQTRATGKKIIAVVDTKELGGTPSATWGYQVLMQANEGYPEGNDLLTRKVNEYEGEHRFGGGTDYDNDPHVIDIFMAPAKGDSAEKDAQHAVLAKYNKDATEPKAQDLAVVPLVYPGS
ncbi:MAG: glucodextranase DOMON-like domain-containing protein [Deltaproteobacteria bacterium]|jgi:hypothetical protein